MPGPRHNSDSAWLLLLAAAALAACAARAALVCDAPEYNFGSLPDTALGVSHTFEVRNAGSAPVVITDVRTSCDCVTTSLARNSLRPGEHAPLDTHFTFGIEAGPQLRAVHLAYRTATDPETVPAQMLSMHLSGSILPPVLRSPNRLDLGVALPGSVATGTVALLSGRCGPFALRAVGLESGGAKAEYTAGLTGTNHLVRLLIPVPSHPGAFSGLVAASTDLPEMPTVPIRYAGRSAPLFEIRPPFLTVHKGRPLNTQIAVSSPYGKAFRILSATATDPRVSVAIAQANTSACLTVTAEACSETFTDALVRLTIDHPVCRMIEVPIRAAPRD